MRGRVSERVQHHNSTLFKAHRVKVRPIFQARRDFRSGLVSLFRTQTLSWYPAQRVWFGCSYASLLLAVRVCMCVCRPLHGFPNGLANSFGRTFFHSSAALSEKLDDEPASQIQIRRRPQAKSSVFRLPPLLLLLRLSSPPPIGSLLVLLGIYKQ